MSSIQNDMDYLSFRPRIRLTAFCNRSCSYCFAKDYLSARDKNDEIDLASMEKILRQCQDEKIQCIGWQGGEPTLHSNIHSIINLHKKYGIKAMVFTNGIISKDTIIALSDIVEAVLVNCNEPTTYKGDELTNLFDNIKLMQELYGKERVAIGINIYSDKMDTSFILEYALKTAINEVRIDITRPSPSNENMFIDYSDIQRTFEEAKKIHKLLLDNGVEYVHFDCPFPLCAIGEENVSYLRNYINSDLGHGQCSTALDITPNSNIASCFCSIQFKDIGIDTFNSLTHAWLFIKYLEDEMKWSTNAKDSCKNCSNRKNRLCQGGCLGYKPGINNVFDRKMLLSKQDLFEKSNIISSLYILYKTNDFKKCYEAAGLYLKDNKYKDNAAIKEIFILSEIRLHMVHLYKDDIIKMVQNSFYPSLDALLYASVLSETNSLDLSIEIAELGLLLDKNLTAYRLHYFLYEAYKQQNQTIKSSMNLVRYYKYLPDINKKRMREMRR